MTTIIRGNSTVRVRINGVQITPIIRCQTTFDFGIRVAKAEVMVPVFPAGLKEWDPVDIEMGPSPSTTYHRFSGYFLEPDWTPFPRAVTLVCYAPLVRAERKKGVIDDANPDGLDLSNAGAGQTDQAMVQFLLEQSGVPNLTIGGTGKLLGTFADDQFFWDSRTSALSFIESLDEICLGFRTFSTPAGSTIRKQITATPASTPALTFTEADIEDGSHRSTVLEVINRWTVTGYDDLAATVSQDSPFLMPGETVAEEEFGSPKIEREFDSDPGDGLSCEEVARWKVQETNRRQHVVSFRTPRHELIAPGMTVKVESARLNVNTLLWVRGVDCEIDEAGVFSQHLTCVGGEGSTAPLDTLAPPIADFSVLVEVESVVIAGTETTIYVVHSEDTSIPWRGTIATRLWSASAGTVMTPNNGDRFTVVLTSLTGVTISLQVTDSHGQTDTRTKTIDVAVAESARVARRLYTASSTHFEALDGVQWRTDTPSIGSVTVVGNGPVAAAGDRLLVTADDLATGAVESQPFGAGIPITAIWVETDVDASRILLGAQNGDVAISEDGGTSFAVKDGPSGDPILRVVINRFWPVQWMVLTASALYRTDDAGATWVTELTAQPGETFRDVVFSHTRSMIVMSSGRLMIDRGGTPQTFPVLVPAVSDVVAVTAHISKDRFYCLDASGRTFYHDADGGTTLVQGADVPDPSQVQHRSLWRDGAIPDLLYLALGTYGLVKSADGLQTSGGYFRIRQPGVGTSPATANYKQVGADGVLTRREITETVVVSKPNTQAGQGESIKALSLWNGSSNNPPPFGWQNLSFDDAAWVDAVQANDAGGSRAPIVGTSGIWSSVNEQNNNEQCLIRHVFTLPAGVITSATITVKYDDRCEGLWINGVFIPGSINTTEDVDPEVDLTVDPSSLLPGAANIIAVWGRNDPLGPSQNPATDFAFVSYKLEIR